MTSALAFPPHALDPDAPDFSTHAPPDGRRAGAPRIPEHDRDRILSGVCDLMGRGYTTTAAAHRFGTTADNVRMWLEGNEPRSRMYARAREQQAHAFAEQVISIADGTDPLADPDPQVRRLQVDARKWFTAKIAPKLYGERMEQTTTVSVSVLHLDALQRLHSASGDRAMGPPLEEVTVTPALPAPQVVGTPDDSGSEDSHA